MIPNGDVTIPIKDGITEGGLIIIGILAVVLTALLIVVLVLWRFGAAIASRLKAVQEQVANDHKNPDGSPMLLRDDLDEKHDQNAKKLDTTDRKLDKVLEIVLSVQQDVAWLMRGQARQDDRLDDLEQTQGKEKR